MFFRRILIVVVVFLSLSAPAMACHEGGAMGFASGNINGLVIDIISMPTFVFASTSGTSGCKNWEFAEATEKERYVALNWEVLAQDSARSSGKSLEALAILSQCTQEAFVSFQKAMHTNHHQLFIGQIHSREDSQVFLSQIQQLIENNPKLSVLCLSPQNVNEVN